MVPKLYSSYSIQISNKGKKKKGSADGLYLLIFVCLDMYKLKQLNSGYAVEYLKWRVLETWGNCSHKKIVAASAVTAFWNLSSVKTRIFTGEIL